MKKEMNLSHSSIISELLEFLKRPGNFLIATHIQPDGDGIGAMLSLERLISSMGKGEIILFCPSPLPEYLSFLPRSDKINYSLPGDRSFSVIVAVDCASRDRMGISEEFWKEFSGILINIDHHLTNDYFGTINLVDPSASSSCELVYNLLEESGINLDLELATCIYTGLVTDTGSYSFSNTTPRALEIGSYALRAGVDPWTISENVYHHHSPNRLYLFCRGIRQMEFFANRQLCVMTIENEDFAATGTTEKDTFGFMECIRTIKDVRIVILIKPSKENGKIDISMRSKGELNISEIAQEFKGGGHRNAAGMTMYGNINEVKNIVVSRVIAYLNNSSQETNLVLSGKK